MDKPLLTHYDIYFDDEKEIYTVKTPTGDNYEISMGNFAILLTEYINRRKSHKVANWLWLLGFLGIHRFYIGDTLKGLLLLGTFGGMLVGWLVDLLFTHKRIDEINKQLEAELVAQAIEETQKDKELDEELGLTDNL